MALEQDTAARLASAARDLILESGLTGLSMRAVARACGVSATAIYRHYEDKDALVTAAVLEGYRAFGSYLMVALQEPTPRARLRRMGERYFDFAREHRHDYQLIFMTNCSELGLEKLDEKTRQQLGSTFQLLQDRIAECQADAGFRQGDPRALAAYVWASLHGLASLLITDGLGQSPEEVEFLIQQQLDLVDAALLRPPEASP